jgi:tRNA(fMet)-specific endonuclease VapC
MNYFLDTNSCIYFLKGSYPQLKEKLISKKPDQIKIPSLVLGELLNGAEKSQQKEKNLELIQSFLFPFEIIGFHENEAKEYSTIRFDLERRGLVIGPNDLIIAAIVKSYNGILVTHNTREFSRIHQLSLEDWCTD